MSPFTRREDLPGSQTGLARRFEGADHDAPVSFFLSDVAPGDGPKLHRHPYTEIFVVNEGRSRFTVGDDEPVDVEAGGIVVVPTGTPHRFENVGDGPLRQTSIHPARRIVTEWLE